MSTIAPETKLYINGTQKGNTWIDTRLPLDVGVLRIGGCEGERFNGLIDDVRIYDTALSAMEIQQHYAEGAKKYRIAEK